MSDGSVLVAGSNTMLKLTTSGNADAIAS